MEFGLYAWQPDGSVDRKLKEGAKTLVSTADRGLRHTLLCSTRCTQAG